MEQKPWKSSIRHRLFPWLAANFAEIVPWKSSVPMKSKEGHGHAVSLF
jgi:hypothetical protein